MLRYLIENVYGWFTLRLFGAYKSIALEVLAYMYTYSYLTNKELDECIDNYDEAIFHFENKRNTDVEYAKLYNNILASLSNMSLVFEMEKTRRNKAK